MNFFLVKVANLRLPAATLVAALALTACGTDVVTAPTQAGPAATDCHGLMCLSGSGSGGSVGNIPPPNTGAFDGSGGSGGVLPDAHVRDCHGLSCLDGAVGSVGNTGDTTPTN